MKRQHASVAALGACAAGLAMLLAQPAQPRTTDRTYAARGDAPVSVVRQTQAALVTLHHARAPQHTATLALCFDCTASHALVRVMRRRQRCGYPTTPTLVVVDRRWPALDSLVMEFHGSSLTLVPQLQARVGITPVALRSANSGQLSDGSFAVGVTAVAALLTPATTAHEQLSP